MRVGPGGIPFWREGEAIAFGPTPISRSGEPRPASPCSIRARAKRADVLRLKAVCADDLVLVEQTRP